MFGPAYGVFSRGARSRWAATTLPKLSAPFRAVQSLASVIRYGLARSRTALPLV